MLCGISGSGKTSTAMEFAADGSVRLSLDQVMHDRFGRKDEDFPASDYLRLHAEVEAELDERLIELLRDGRDIVLDYGLQFWTKTGRDRYKQIIEDHGGRWELIYLQASRDVLLDRIAKRNLRRDADAYFITEELLDEFIDQFEEPHGEMEIVRPQGAPTSEPLR